MAKNYPVFSGMPIGLCRSAFFQEFNQHYNKTKTMLSIVIALLIGLAIGQYVTIKIDPALIQGVANVWASIVGKMPDIREALSDISNSVLAAMGKVDRSFDPTIQADLDRLKAKCPD